MAKNNNSNYRKFNGKGANSQSNSKFRPKKQGMQSDVMGSPYKQSPQGKPGRKQRNSADVDEDAVISRGNPVSFYTKYDRFVTDAATLPFAKPVGSYTNINAYAKLAGDAETPMQLSATYYTPGVMGIYFVPTIGVSKDYSSPINRSSIRFYTYLRSNQKASAAYDHQDVTMMEVALDSCYMFHGLMTKIYAILNQFTPVNEYYSRATIAACGADFEDIRANVQDFRAYINTFAYSLGQYALPRDITLFDRHRWMVEGQYTDSESTKAQTYMFVPCGFWKYDNTVATGSQLTWVDYIGEENQPTIHTFAQLKALGDSLLNAISGEEDFAIISGDIYNFYGGDTYTLPYIDENYSVLPVFDRTVLSQIENLSIVPLDMSSLLISQNPSVNEGAIIFKPQLAAAWNAGVSLDNEMNFHWDRPSAEDVIEASRLMAVLSATDGILACGTELVTRVKAYTRNILTGAFQAQDTNTQIFYQSGASDLSASTSAIQRLLTFAQFDWAPQLQFWYATGVSSRPYMFSGTTWDIDNYDTIPSEYLANIHTGCLLSLFKVGVNRE
nr:putative capsid [Marmot picobirnavirus]AVX53702.1 putative capsid [Marmot picobirnavirus]